MKSQNSFALVALGLLASGSAGMAQIPGVEGRSPAFQKLVDCRAVTESAARLACFDAQVAALEQAERSKNIVIADKAQVKQARRSLFGFSLPKIALFGDGAKDEAEEEEFERIETTIQSARQLGDGRWFIILEDGARWMQTDSQQMGRPAKPGDKIAIRKAAMGSFFANVNGQRAIRMKREN
jgi:hypothetical protein